MKRTVAGLAVTAVVAGSSLLGASAAFAEGAGYGGNAGELSVTWAPPVEGAVAAPDVPPGGGPTVDPEKVGIVEAGPTLTVIGLGFRQLTKINVQVGEIADLERKTDITGTLTVNVPAQQSEEVPPGASVLATGLSPSGTTRTLVGSVPPKPSGVAPSSLVPWFAAAFAAGGAVVLARRVRQQKGDAAQVASAGDVGA
ncbi:MAG: hypothetical protein QG597_57 [Actinomycetota bacterium]|nr:hypothetical protein [Actinomycetota bacterium]